MNNSPSSVPFAFTNQSNEPLDIKKINKKDEFRGTSIKKKKKWIDIKFHCHCYLT